jgi:endonuclease/exonuclease/phosphatase (EEP) superfamily protein YafD
VTARDAVLRRPRRRTAAVGAAAAALPWSWFALRDPLGDVGDVVAILLVPLVLLAVVAAVVVARRHRVALLAALSTLLLGLVAVAGPWWPADAGPVGPGGVSVVAANVQSQRTAADAAGAVPADVVVLAESTRALDPPFAAEYPHRELALTGGPDLAVYSRYPLRVLDRPGPDLPGLRLRVAGPAGPFVLYALHVPRPWFTTRGGYQASVGEHHRFVAAVAARAAAETLPVVVAGDLNASDRTRGYRLLASGLVDAALAAPAAPTSTGQWAPLLVRIDHLLVSRGWCADGAGQVALPGSDHRAVTAVLGPCG